MLISSFCKTACQKTTDKVNLWLDNDFFEKNPVPQNADEYRTFIGKEYDFLKKRNRRILNFKINM